MNNIYKVIWSKVANALVVVSELARSKGVSGRNSVAASSNTVKVRTKLTALSVALSFCFGASSVFAADATYDNVTVSTSLTVTGTATVNGKNIATEESVNNAVAGKLDKSDFNSFKSGEFTTLGTKVAGKLDTSDFNSFKSGEFTTLGTKVDGKLDTSTFSTFKNGIEPRVTNLENNKLNKTDFTTFQSTVNGQITNLTNTKLNTATFNQFNTNLTGLVNQVLGTAFTVAQMQGALPAYNYTGIKYFRANSTGTDASATGTDAVAVGPASQATAVNTVAVGHESKALKDAAVAVGRKSYANSNDGIAVGNSAAVTAGGKYAIALGSQAQAGSKSGNDSDGNPLTENTYDGSTTYVVGDGHSAIAIGNKAISRGQNNIAIGKNALTTNKDAANAFSQDSVAIGSGAETIAASSAIAFGKGARVGVRGSSVGADSAIAMGDGAQATGLDATAIGHSAQAGKSGLAAGSNANAAGVNSVALGNAAQTTTEGAVAIGDRAYAAPWRTISIGQDAGKGQATDTVGDKNEQINIGVRSGENVDGQLNIGIGQAAGSNVKGKGNIALGQNAGQYIGGTNSSVGNNISIGTNANQYTTPTDIIESVAIGFNSQAGTRAMSLGVKTKATADGSVAIGNSAQANGAGSMAIGKDSVVNGADNVALGRSSIANTDLKQGYLTSTASSTVVSVGKSDLLRRVVNVADGADDQDAATVAQLKKVSDDVYKKVNTQINNLHIAATTGINYDVTPRTATENSVTLSKNGKKTIIGSVADGVLDDDAVNVSQLKREINEKTTHYFSVNQGGTTTLGNFNNNGAVGAKSLAIGMDVRTAGDRGVALGNSTSAEAFGSIAIGALYDGSNALDDNDPQTAKQTVTKSSTGQPFKYNMAIGAGAASEGNNAIAIGTLAKTTTKQQNVVSPDRAVALGYYAASSAAKANAIGERATATQEKANAFGSQAYAGGVSATAIGSAASASGTNSIAMGSNQRVTAANSGSIGYAGDLTLNTTGRDLAGTYATNATSVSGTGTYSIGNTNSNITSNESGVFGNNNFVQGKENIRVMGNNNTITQNNQNPQGGTAVAPTLKNVYVTGHANKIDTGTKPLEASKNIFVMGAGNTIGNSQNNATAAQITDSYVIGTGNTVNNPNRTLTGSTANPSFGDDPSDPSTTKSKIGRGYFILGNNVTATLDDSVYLGTNSAYISAADRSAGTQYNVPTDPYAALLHAKYTGHWATGVVTVGSVSSPRRIQGVAAGLVGPNSMDAINGSQLYAHTRPVGFVADNTEGLAGKDLDKLIVDEAGITNMVKRSAGQAIKLEGGADKTKLSDNNIGTLVKGTNQVDIKLAKDLKELTSAEFKDGTNTTTINDKGVSITNGPSMTTAGINAGNQKITNVANGVADADAVNVSQLKAARTVVKSDDHSVLVQESENGLTKTYDVSVAMPVVYTKADGTKVYKLADGTFNTNANGGAATKVEAADVIASMHNAAGSTTTAIALANVASSIQNKAGANFAEKLNAANTANPNNAVNVSDLKLTKDSITSSTQGGGFGLKDQDDAEVKQDLGTTVKVKGDANVYTKVVTDGTGKALEVGLKDTVTLGKAGTDGKDGKIGVNGKDGSAVVINGKDGSIGLNGKDGKDGLTMKSAQGKPGVDGKDGETKTRIVYELKDKDGNPVKDADGKVVKEEVATLNDGLKFGANAGTVHNAKLNTQVDVKGAVTNTDWNKFDAGKNIMTNIDGNTITVGLAKDLDVNSVTTGDTKVENSGITIKNGSEQSKTVSLTKTGLNNGGNQVVNMDSGLKDSQGNKVTLTEATGDVLNNGVNVGDLKETVNKLIGPSDIGGFGLKDKAGNEFKQSLGTTAQITGDKNINTKVVDVLDAQGQATGKKALEVGLNPEVELGKKGNDGVDGKLTVNGKDGSSVVVDGSNGSIGLNGKDGKDGLTMKSEVGEAGLDQNNATDPNKPDDKGSKTRLVYEHVLKDKDGNPQKGQDGKPVTVKEQVATLNDGLVFAGNNTDKENKHKLNSKVNIVGDSTAEQLKDFKSATGNLNVVADGNNKLTVQMSKNLKNLNSVTLENPTDAKKSVTLTVTDKGELNVGGDKAEGNQVTGVKSSITDKAGATFADKLKNAADKDNGNPNNAVNVGDLYNVFSGESGGGFGLKDKAGNEFKQDLGTTAQITGDKNINTKVVDVLDAQGQATGKKALEVGLNPEIELGEKAVPGVNGQPGKDGVDGKIGVNGKDGSAVVINGKDGSIGLNGKDGKDGLTMKSAQGKPGVDGKDGETKTRIVYETKDKDGKPVTEEVATLNDGLKFGDNSGNVHNAKLNSQVNVKGAETNKDWGKFDGGKNIMTQIKGNTITVGLANDINVNSVTTNKVTVGDTTITTDGVTINNGPSMTKSGGINANNTTIKNVAPGVNSTDAVNVSQLRAVEGKLNRADKHLRAGIAGANAAAGLPQAYLPGKSMVAVSAGTYRGEGAVALGMSRISDNGKVVVKITGNSDTRGNLGASLGAGYQW
jgi:S-layer domain protein